MWNYDYILPTFFMLIIFTIYYLALPRPPVRMNRTFLWILAAESMAMLMDIAASRADENYRILPVPFLYAMNALYFAVFLFRIYLFFRFTMDVLHLKPENAPAWTWGARVPWLLAEVLVLTSFQTGLVFYIDETGYHHGSWYHVIHACFFLYLLISFLMLIVYRERLSRFGWYSAMGYNGILFIGVIVRILMPEYLIMNTFCILAVIVIYLSFENPNLYLDVRGRVFNVRAFQDLLDEWIGQKPYQVLAFVIHSYHEQRGIYGGTQMDRGLSLICQYLTNTFQDLTVFYLHSGRFALLGDADMNTETIRRTIYDRFQKPWETEDAQLDLGLAFVQVGSASDLDTEDKVLGDLLIALDKAANLMDDQESIIDLDHTRDIDRQMYVKRCLDLALEQDKVEVFLQPLIDASSGRLIGAEALARIRDTEGVMISPVEFIPVAEHSGRINLLGEQVFRKTCQFISTHDLDSLGMSWINVNVSPIQCMRKDIYQRFSAILEELGVDSGRIHLEITEQSIVDFTVLQRQIQQLRDRGFQFVLDDYGTGYSNLTRVKHYPFVNIKLDMEVVWDYFRDMDEFLPSIVQAFKQMNFSITAEGIETREMAEALRIIGCDYLQGFYYSKPLPQEEFVKKYAA